MRRAPNKSAASPRWTSQVPSTEEDTTQTAGSLHSSGSHSSRPERSQAEWPQVTAPAQSPNEDVALGSMTLPPYPMLGGRTSQDRLPATDAVSGGPSAILAVALNDKLDWIAQRFDQLECHQDAAKRHSDDSAQQLQLLLQWAQQCDKAERALTDDNDPFMDRRPAGDSPGDQIPTGQQVMCDEQAHTPGVNDSSAQCGGASTPARHAKQTRKQEPNDSSAQSGSAHTPEPITGSNKPRSDRWPPTDESFLWNNEFHKKIINKCDHQDCINWECKLGALAHLLSVAEAKQAIATVHGHLDTQYIEANRRVHDAHDAIDRHSQSWAMRTTELTSIVLDTGTEHAPADDSGLEQAPAMGVPPLGSTTHHFITQEGNEAY